ncbi:hypothetical protein C5167_003432 [Papaver somniferum]|uniref:F-box domain-containing protein n=1 Tax=Papaver somniferum TaxID=3469 RepID=A0A4Y7L4Y0_PAPSO|nr:hypothetical protein C5167_003432 [Papaver somniferum]
MSSTLPQDMIIDILRRLPVTSISRFKCVCKSWLDLFDDIQFRKLHYDRINIQKKSNLIKIIAGKGNDLYSIDVYDSGKVSEVVKIVDYPFYNEKYRESDDNLGILGSCNGLVCIRPRFDLICFWNPSTKDHRIVSKVQQTETPSSWCRFGFGYDLKTRDYKLVSFESFMDERHGSQIMVYSLASNSWSTTSYIMPYTLACRARPTSLYFNGALHWLTDDQRFSFLLISEMRHPLVISSEHPTIGAPHPRSTIAHSIPDPSDDDLDFVDGDPDSTDGDLGYGQKLPFSSLAYGKYLSARDSADMRKIRLFGPDSKKDNESSGSMFEDKFIARVDDIEFHSIDQRTNLIAPQTSLLPLLSVTSRLPTLEDVVALTGLPIHSSHDFEEDNTEAMDKTDSDLYDELVKVRRSIARKASTDTADGSPRDDKRASLSGWMNYWAPAVTEATSKKDIPSIVRSYDPPTHGHSDDAELAAFLTYWLNHDFFECSPRDIIREDLFRIAVKMVRGISYPLSPMFLGGVSRHLDILISDLEAANSSRHVIESFVPTSFLQMWFWERFPASRSGVNKLVVINDDAPSTSGRLPAPPTRYPRTTLYEKQHVKKATNEFMWIVDDLGSFEARPYDNAPSGISFLGPNFVFLEDVLDSETSSLSDDDWDSISIATSGYIHGYFEGKFCAVSYNVDMVARQLGYDQGSPLFFPILQTTLVSCRIITAGSYLSPMVLGFVCDVADPVEAVSPRKLNVIGRIRLDTEVASSHDIKAGSRGKSIKSDAKKGTNIPVVSEPVQRPHVVVRNRGASAASSRGQQGSRVGGASSLQSSASSSNPQEKSMGRVEQAFEQSNSSRNRKY